MKKLNLLILIFLTSSFALAEAANSKREYDVEIIVFEDAHARYLNNETWPQNNLDKPKRGRKAKSGDIKNLKPAILRNRYNNLNASSQYKILFYGAWRQTGLDKNKAFKIDINKLKNNHKKRSKNTLNGNIKVVLARYLHVYSDLEYRRNTNTPVTESTISENANYAANVFPINNHRRMRSKELHYIDHPLVGMLVQINPVKVSAK